MTNPLPRVTIVGVGALGSHVAMLLRGEARLRIIDFDHVEQKNTLAQFHHTKQVRRNKAAALKQVMDFLWDVKLEAVPHKLTQDNADELLSDTSLIIDCVDNGEARRLIRDWVDGFNGYATAMREERQHIAVLHAGLAADGEFGRIAWGEKFLIDDAPGVGAPTCEGGEFLPFISIVASYAARSAQLFLRSGVQAGWSVHPGGAVRT